MLAMPQMSTMAAHVAQKTEINSRSDMGHRKNLAVIFTYGLTCASAWAYSLSMENINAATTLESKTLPRYNYIISRTHSDNTAEYGFGDLPKTTYHILATVEAETPRKAQNKIKKTFPRARFGGQFGDILEDASTPTNKGFARFCEPDDRFSRFDSEGNVIPRKPACRCHYCQLREWKQSQARVK